MRQVLNTAKLKPHEQSTCESGEANDKPLQTESRVKEDGALAISLFLTALSVILLLWSWTSVGFNSLPLMVLMTALMLLFNHIAFFTAKQGRTRRLLKTVARVWIVLVGGCLIWTFYDLIRSITS